jgi:hypothetical protein
VPPQFSGPGAAESLAKFTTFNKSPPPPSDLLESAIDRMCERMSPVWNSISRIPLSLNDAVFGSHEIDHLDAKTSPGWPWTTSGYTSKGQVFSDPNAMRFLEDDWHHLNTPYYTPTGWTMNLKDELRPQEKAHKPRAFMGGPVEMVVHGKRLFGRQDAAIAAQPLATPVRVGFVPLKGGMSELHALHSTRRFHWDGDYHNWDGSVPVWLFEACMRVRLRFLNPHDYQRVVNYYRILCFGAMADPFGALIYKDGGMPSGTYTTATDNSIMNALLITMFELQSGADDFVISVYGDDNLVSTDQPLDLTLLQNFLSDLGLDYTSAEKNAPPHFKELIDCTFLKLHFSPTTPIFPWRDPHRVAAIIEWRRSNNCQSTYFSRLNSALVLSYGTPLYHSLRELADSFGHQPELLNNEKIHFLSTGTEEPITFITDNGGYLV